MFRLASFESVRRMSGGEAMTNRGTERNCVVFSSQACNDL